MTRVLLLAVCLVASLLIAPLSPRAADGGVRVRFGDHASYSRAVFDLSTQTGYRVASEGGVIRVTFDSSMTFDLSALRRVAPKALSGARALNDGRSVVFELHDSRLRRHFLSGNKVVIDFAFGGETPAVARSAAPVAAKPAAARPAAVEPVRKPTVIADLQPRKIVQRPVQTAPAPKPKPVFRPSPARAEPQSPAPPVVATREVPANAVPVTYDLRPGRTLLRFKWPERVGAVAVHRGEHIWVAFDLDLPIDPGADANVAKGPVTRVVTEPSRHGSVVRIDIAAGAALSLTVDGNDWVVDIGGGRGRAETAIRFEAQADAAGGPRIFAPIKDAGEPILIDDPVVGDRLVVVPLKESGLGVRPDRRYILFDMPSTPQGIAIRFNGEALKVQLDAQGLSIGGQETLHLSSEAEIRQPGDAPPGVTSGGDEDRFHVFDFAAWGQDADLETTRQDMLYRIAVATPAARNGERLTLARFLVSRRLAQEALGVMARIESEDKYADTNPSYRALRGLAHLFAGHLAEAAADLRHPKLEQAIDAALFRGLLAVKRREFEEARREFRAAQGEIANLPEDMQPEIRVAFAETALALNDPRLAGEQVSALLKYGGTASRREEAKLLAARIHGLTGESAEAGEMYAELAESVYRPVRARARFEETNLLLEEGRIDVNEALERLERLRFAWRGGVFEFELMRRLGDLYIRAGQYRKGMLSMRQTVERFPDLREAQKLAGDMKDIFAGLFEGQDADAMSPVTAMALYYEFRELTPDGDRGDRMIRRLADRLAGVELLDEAAKLLDHQVTHRLKGEEKAKVGAQLAVLHLLDGKPEEAIEALRKTRLLSISPELRQERVKLEAQAQTEIGRYDRALVMIAGISGDDVDRMRTEILWRARDWERAAASLSGRLTVLRNSDKSLDKQDRRDILRFAIASSLAGDRQALSSVRTGFAERMKGQPEWPAFQVVTAEDRRDSAEFRNLAAEIAQVDQFEAFMSAYRVRLRSQSLSAIN